MMKMYMQYSHVCQGSVMIKEVISSTLDMMGVSVVTNHCDRHLFNVIFKSISWKLKSTFSTSSA